MGIFIRQRACCTVVCAKGPLYVRYLLMAFSLTPHLCEVTIRALSHLIAVEGGATDEQPEGGSAAWLTATIGPFTMVRWVPGGP
jgi:hypothetical protein